MFKLVTVMVSEHEINSFSYLLLSCPPAEPAPNPVAKSAVAEPAPNHEAEVAT